jgi:hypothetical protein
MVYDKIDDTDTRCSNGGAGAEPLARFSKHFSKISNWGYVAKAPARVLFSARLG